ncbi:MAG: YfhO family protein [Erysipelotrichaceae bacterium]|nr:YfhO family protein [Erysipelotrichaceae bacterium]
MKLLNKKWINYALVAILTTVSFLCLLGLKGSNGYLLATTDAREQVIPFYYHLWDVQHLQKSLFFDWYSALGTNMAGIVAHYGLISPINLLLLFIKREQIEVFFNVLVVIRLVLASSSMFFLLDKKHESVFNILLAPLYALNAYMIMYCIFPMWMDIAIIFPLLLYCLEKLMEEDTCKLGYMICLAFSFMMDVNIVPMIIIFVILFTSIKLFLLDKAQRGIAAINVIVSSIIGSLISLVILLPGAMQIMVSSRIGTSFIDLILAGYKVVSYMDYQKWVMGTLAVIAIVFGLSFIRKFKDKNCYAYLILLVIMAFSMISEGSNLVWHLGTYAYWSMRFAFMMNCLSLLLIGEVLSITKSIEIKNLIVPFLVILVSGVAAFISFRTVQWNSSSLLVKVLLLEMGICCLCLLINHFNKVIFKIGIVLTCVVFSLCQACLCLNNPISALT